MFSCFMIRTDIKKKKAEPDLLDIFSFSQSVDGDPQLFPTYGLYFHPDIIHISPPADGNQNITSVGLFTDLLSFFPLPSQRF